MNSTNSFNYPHPGDEEAFWTFVESMRGPPDAAHRRGRHHRGAGPRGFSRDEDWAPFFHSRGGFPFRGRFDTTSFPPGPPPVDAEGIPIPPPPFDLMDDSEESDEHPGVENTTEGATDPRGPGPAGRPGHPGRGGRFGMRGGGRGGMGGPGGRGGMRHFGHGHGFGGRGGHRHHRPGSPSAEGPDFDPSNPEFAERFAHMGGFGRRGGRHGGPWGGRRGFGRGMRPMPGAVNPEHEVFDAPEAYIIYLVVPGCKKTDLDISFEATTNTIKVAGEIKRPSEITDDMLDNLITCPREVGKFTSIIPLDRDAKVVSDDLTAKLEDGILKIELPKLTTSEEWTEIKKVTIA